MCLSSQEKRLNISTAPLVWLHSEDPYRPADILRHLRHTTPMIHEEPIKGLPEPDLDNLERLEGLSDQVVALTSDDDVTASPPSAWLLGQAPDASGQTRNATPCAVILVEKNARDVDAFYFYFYSYNRGANISQIFEPLSRWVEPPASQPHMTFENHVGDW